MKVVRLLLLTCCLTSPGAQASDHENQSRLQALKDQIIALKNSLTSKNSELDQLEEQLAAREIAAGKLQESIHKLESEITSLQKETLTLEHRRSELETYSKEQQTLIAREINGAYRLGKAEPVKLLLNQEDPQKFTRTLKYYQYLVKARQNKIEQFEQTIRELKRVEEDLTNKQHSLLAAKDQNAVQLAELATEQEKRRQIIGSLNKALKDDNSRLSKLSLEKKQLEELIARLEKELHDLGPQASEPFPKNRGKLPWPINGKVSHNFGSSRGQALKWSGLLISAAAGEPVKSVYNGRVVFSDYLRGHGLLIILDHGDGYLTLYAHNQLLLKEVGDWVQRGDTIAQAGSSGGLADSALYFEIRHNGTPQDPKRWLKAQG